MKKTHIMLFTVIFILIGLLTTKLGMAADKTKSSGLDIEFQVSIDRLAAEAPKSMFFYRCAPDKSSQKQKEPLQEFFGKTSFMELKEESGGIFSADMTRLWIKPPKPEAEIERLKKEEAFRKTDEFLKSINGTPKASTLRRFSEDRIEFIKKSRQMRSVPVGWNVTYRKLLRDYEVTGPGGKIKTYFDSKGEIAGYIRVWRELKTGKKARIISPNEAAEKFKKDPIGRALLSGVEKIEVTDIQLAYLEQGISASQNYLQPIYFFKAMAYTKNGKDKMTKLPYTRYIPALEQPPEDLWPKGREHKPGERTEKEFKPGEDD